VKWTIPNYNVLRWVLLFLIGIAEVVCISLRIEAPSSGFLSYTKGLPSIFVTSLAVVTILGWVRARGRVLDLPIFQDQDLSHRPWRMVLAQLGAFAAFFWLTILVFEGGLNSPPFPIFLTLAWVFTGLAAGVFWVLAAMPASAWIRLARQNSSVVLAGIVIIFASWVMGFATNRAWEPLRYPTFWLVEWLLKAFGQDVVSEPADFMLGTRQFSVSMYIGCTGYEGIGLIVAFVGAYFWLFRRRLRFPQAFLILPCAIVVIWLVNAVRIALLVMVGTYVSPQIASGGFHSQVGWLGFIAVALGVVAVTQRMSFFAVTQSDPRDKARAPDPTTAYLAPLTALLAVTMVSGAFSSGFDWLYPARVLGTAATIWFFWRRSLTWPTLMRCWSWGSVGIGVMVFAIWIGLEQITGGSYDDGSSITKSLGGMPAGLAGAWLLFRVLGSVVMVPIAEELAFRGYLLRRLITADFDQLSVLRFTGLSFLVSSLLFGALHGRWLAGTLAGMFYAWALYRRGRVADAVIAHATTNALIAGAVLIFGNWSLWQ
jgi:exosortase E/protease (VPEID-CTERM system)